MLFMRLVLVLTVYRSVSNPLVATVLTAKGVHGCRVIINNLRVVGLPISCLLLHVKYVPRAIIVITVIVSRLYLTAHLCVLGSVVKLRVHLCLGGMCFGIVVIDVLTMVMPFLLRSCMDNDFCKFYMDILLYLLYADAAVCCVKYSGRRHTFIVTGLHNFGSGFVGR